jgi:hypothetical protein
LSYGKTPASIAHGSLRSALQWNGSRENIKHFRDLLRAATSESERHSIQTLLDEELAEQREAGAAEGASESRTGGGKRPR